MSRTPRTTRLVALTLEDRLTPAAANLGAAEQYFLELLNRARANPTAEAARFGIELNEGLAAGTISAAPAQSLAPNDQLASAIDAHLAYLGAAGTLSHTGAGGTTVGQRVAAAGYASSYAGENLALSTGIGIDARGAETLHRMLFVDDGYAGRGHRVNMLRPQFEEVGAGLASGTYNGRPATYGGTDFGSRNGNPFLTGVAYTDAVLNDDFYTPGEGVGGVTVVAIGPAGTFRTTTAAAGGYSLELPAGAYTVAFTTTAGQSATFSATVGTSNVKLDYVPDSTPPTPPLGSSPPAATSPPPVTIPQVKTDPPPAGGVPIRGVVVGADAGGSATLKVLDPATGKSLFELASPNTFGTGARVATADFTGDGVPDVVVGTGPGGVTQVRVIDGKSGQDVFTFQPFESGFVGGVYVAAADVTADGKPDLIVTPDEGGGPRVDVYSGAGFTKAASFFGIDDANFRGGARVGTGDINGDKVPDLIVAAGFQGGPRVAGFDGRTLTTTRARVFADFFAFEQTLRNGIFVAAGDIDGDGYADLIAGGGPGGGPRVTVYSGAALLANRHERLADFFAGDAADRGGVRVSTEDLDADGRADVIVGSGPRAAAGPRVTAYAGSLLGTGVALPAFVTDAFPGYSGGVFVG